MNKKLVGVVVGLASLFALPFVLANLPLDSAKAESKSASSIFVANVSSMLSLTISSCGTAEANTVNLTPNAVLGNPYSSCHLEVDTTTNAPGYNLSIAALDGAQAGVYDGTQWNNWTQSGSSVQYGDNNTPAGDCGASDMCLKEVISENTPPTLPTLGTNYIPSFQQPASNPDHMTVSSSSLWGIAVPSNQEGVGSGSVNAGLTGFTSTYSDNVFNEAVLMGKYAKLPTLQNGGLLIRERDESVNNERTFVFFGTGILPVQAPGVYKGSVLFTAIANPVIEPAPVVIAIFPPEGLPAGGTQIDIYGAYFVDGATVTIGGTTCTSVNVISSSHLTCVLPAKTAGSYAVVVTTRFGQSNSNVLYTYTATPADPGSNPYDSTTGGNLFAGNLLYSAGGSVAEDGSISPQGRSVFENLAEAVGNEDYDNLWIALAGGALLAGLLVFASFLLGRKWDIYIMEELSDNRPEIVKILVEKVGLDAKEVIASLQKTPSLVVEKVSKSDGNLIVKLFEEAKAKVEIVRHGRKSGDSDDG